MGHQKAGNEEEQIDRVFVKPNPRNALEWNLRIGTTADVIAVPQHNKQRQSQTDLIKPVLALRDIGIHIHVMPGRAAKTCGPLPL